MDDIHIGLLFGLIALLIIISAFFSGSETSMLSLNRYRLKHLSKNNNKAAKRASDLLENPERLIGMILIGNNLVNILASSIATVIAIRLFGDAGIAIATLILTVVILIFAEITPKTIAAYYPEKFAFPASWLLRILLKIFYPLVWSLNLITGLLLRLMGISPKTNQEDHLSSEELRTIVDEAGELIPERHQGMLLNILDIEHTNVEDIMIPRAEIFAIDLNANEDVILNMLQNCEYTRVPVYENDINNVVGILHMRNVGKLLSRDVSFNKDGLKDIIREPVFTPAITGLHQQLINFQTEKRRIALVVDEYGSVMGLVTLEDILEEIVGEFTSNLIEDSEDFDDQDDGSFIIQGSATLRDINRHTGWDLPIDGPKTLNGLVLEHLQTFPDAAVTIEIGKYAIEILELDGNVIKNARVRYIGG